MIDILRQEPNWTRDVPRYSLSTDMCQMSMTCEEIAQELGCTQQAVNLSLNNALRKLRRHKHARSWYYADV